MDIQAEISWIRTELIKVRDPELILAFKNLLKYKRTQNTEKSDFDKSLDRAFADIKEGRTMPHSEVKKKYDKWL